VKRQNQRISSLLNQKEMHARFSQLHPSHGTLIIVPTALLLHWVNQIKMHVQHSYCCGSKIPICFRHKHTRRQNRISSFPTSLWHDSSNECDVEFLTNLGSHVPFIFIDEDPTLPLPDSSFLAQFVIVLSSTQRLSNEKKNGSLLMDDNEVETEKGSRNSSADIMCPFLQIFWLRLVVDEGHTTGNMTTNASEMCCRISAERRWCVTGTPTPQTKTNDGLKNVLGLLSFIKYEYFNPQVRDGIEVRGMIDNFGIVCDN